MDFRFSSTSAAHEFRSKFCEGDDIVKSGRDLEVEELDPEWRLALGPRAQQT